MPASSDLLEEVAELVAARTVVGQRHFAEAAKTAVYRLRPDLFERVPFDDDDAFLEPLLFASISSDQPGASLDELMFGAVPDDAKPSRFSVTTDTGGAVYIPRIGYLHTDLAQHTLTMVWGPGRRTLHLEDDGHGVHHRPQDTVHIPGSRIEILRRQHPLLERFYRNAGGVAPVEVQPVSGDSLRALQGALELIRSAASRYYTTLAATTRRVVLFKADEVNSFAALGAHGTAFINAQLGDDEVFYVEDLTHQCGHVLFSAATAYPEEYFTIGPDTPLKLVTGVATERRSVYETLHGLFTELFMSLVLDWCCDHAPFNSNQRHESLGRLAFILTRYSRDLQNLSAHGIFSETGSLIYRACQAKFLEIYGKRAGLVRAADLVGQPYNFDSARFQASNPLGSLET